jgi:hypothetical protein
VEGENNTVVTLFLDPRGLPRSFQLNGIIPHMSPFYSLKNSSEGVQISTLCSVHAAIVPGEVRWTLTASKGQVASSIFMQLNGSLP